MTSQNDSYDENGDQTYYEWCFARDIKINPIYFNGIDISNAQLQLLEAERKNDKRLQAKCHCWFLSLFGDYIVYKGTVITHPKTFGRPTAEKQLKNPVALYKTKIANAITDLDDNREYCPIITMILNDQQPYININGIFCLDSKEFNFWFCKKDFIPSPI